MEVNSDKFKDKMESIEDFFAYWLNSVIKRWLKLSYKCLKRIIKVVLMYLDITTDFILLGIVMIALDGTEYHENIFAYQVALILFLSIIIPLLMSAIMVAVKTPLVLLRAKQWKIASDSKVQLAIAGTITFLSFPFVPAIIIIGSENANDERKALKSKNQTTAELARPSILEKFQYLTDYVKECKSALLIFKRFEMSLELVVQMSIHLMMVLLGITVYPTESGLQSVFQESEDTTRDSWWYRSGMKGYFQKIETDYNLTIVFFILSVIWSFKTCAKTSIKIKTQSKSFLPLKAQILLFFRYLLLFFIRIGAIVTYYAPYIGLLGILDHYQAETLPLDPKIWCNINSTDDQQYHFWNPLNDQFESVKVSDLFRSNYAKCSDSSVTMYPGYPSTELYTGIKFGRAFGLFWVLYLFYGLTITLIKRCMNSDFRTSSLFEKCMHILETLNSPEAFGDWDMDNDLDVAGHLQKWKNVLKEMVVMVIMQFITNLILLVPLLVTGKKIYLSSY